LVHGLEVPEGFFVVRRASKARETVLMMLDVCVASMMFGMSDDHVEVGTQTGASIIRRCKIVHKGSSQGCVRRSTTSSIGSSHGLLPESKLSRPLDQVIKLILHRETIIQASQLKVHRALPQQHRSNRHTHHRHSRPNIETNPSGFTRSITLACRSHCA
jgi:hypothetical protein